MPCGCQNNSRIDKIFLTLYKNVYIFCKFIVLLKQFLILWDVWLGLQLSNRHIHLILFRCLLDACLFLLFSIEEGVLLAIHFTNFISQSVHIWFFFTLPLFGYFPSLLSFFTTSSGSVFIIAARVISRWSLVRLTALSNSLLSRLQLLLRRCLLNHRRLFLFFCSIIIIGKGRVCFGLVYMSLGFYFTSVHMLVQVRCLLLPFCVNFLI